MQIHSHPRLTGCTAVALAAVVMVAAGCATKLTTEDRALLQSPKLEHFPRFMQLASGLPRVDYNEERKQATDIAVALLGSRGSGEQITTIRKYFGGLDLWQAGRLSVAADAGFPDATGFVESALSDAETPEQAAKALLLLARLVRTDNADQLKARKALRDVEPVQLARVVTATAAVAAAPGVCLGRLAVVSGLPKLAKADTAHQLALLRSPAARSQAVACLAHRVDHLPEALASDATRRSVADLTQVLDRAGCRTLAKSRRGRRVLAMSGRVVAVAALFDSIGREALAGATGTKVLGVVEKHPGAVFDGCGAVGRAALSAIVDKLGKKAQKTILARALADQRAAVHGAALDALRELPAMVQPLITLITALAAAPDASVRLRAVGLCKTNLALADLLPRLTDTSQEVRHAVMSERRALTAKADKRLISALGTAGALRAKLVTWIYACDGGKAVLVRLFADEKTPADQVKALRLDLSEKSRGDADFAIVGAARWIAQRERVFAEDQTWWPWFTTRHGGRNTMIELLDSEHPLAVEQVVAMAVALGRGQRKDSKKPAAVNRWRRGLLRHRLLDDLNSHRCQRDHVKSILELRNAGMWTDADETLRLERWRGLLRTQKLKDPVAARAAVRSLSTCFGKTDNEATRDKAAAEAASFLVDYGAAMFTTAAKWTVDARRCLDAKRPPSAAIPGVGWAMNALRSCKLVFLREEAAGCDGATYKYFRCEPPKVVRPAFAALTAMGMKASVEEVHRNADDDVHCSATRTLTFAFDKTKYFKDVSAMFSKRLRAFTKLWLASRGDGPHHLSPSVPSNVKTVKLFSNRLNGILQMIDAGGGDWVTVQATKIVQARLARLMSSPACPPWKHSDFYTANGMTNRISLWQALRKSLPQHALTAKLHKHIATAMDCYRTRLPIAKARDRRLARADKLFKQGKFEKAISQVLEVKRNYANPGRVDSMLTYIRDKQIKVRLKPLRKQFGTALDACAKTMVQAKKLSSTYKTARARRDRAKIGRLNQALYALRSKFRDQQRSVRHALLQIKRAAGPKNQAAVASDDYQATARCLRVRW